jgi:hypothetical protein
VLGNRVPYRYSKGGDVSVRRCHFIGVCIGMSVGKKSLCGEKKDSRDRNSLPLSDRKVLTGRLNCV